MNITIALPPEIELEILSQAEAQGIRIEDYLPRLIESALSLRQSQDVLRQGGEAWLALLHQTPPIASGNQSISDDSLRRENLYEDRA